MSLTTNITAIGLSTRGAHVIQERLDEYNAAHDITGYRADQHLVELGENAGGLKFFGSLLAACFNYGPGVDDWQGWFNEAISQYESPYIVIHGEDRQIAYVQGHGWLERNFDNESSS